LPRRARLLFQELLSFDYANAGTLRFIGWDDNITSDELQGMKAKRITHLIWLIASGKIEQIVNDHKSACKCGYLLSGLGNGNRPTDMDVGFKTVASRQGGLLPP
jgi:hypothetical protein